VRVFGGGGEYGGVSWYDGRTGGMGMVEGDSRRVWGGVGEPVDGDVVRGMLCIRRDEAEAEREVRAR
jgi:hypothetical protein